MINRVMEKQHPPLFKKALLLRFGGNSPKCTGVLPEAAETKKTSQAEAASQLAEARDMVMHVELLRDLFEQRLPKEPVPDSPAPTDSGILMPQPGFLFQLSHSTSLDTVEEEAELGKNQAGFEKLLTDFPFLQKVLSTNGMLNKVKLAGQALAEELKQKKALQELANRPGMADIPPEHRLENLFKIRSPREALQKLKAMADHLAPLFLSPSEKTPSTPLPMITSLFENADLLGIPVLNKKP